MGITDHMYEDDFVPLADLLIIRCPICGHQNKYPIEDKTGALWSCCDVEISIKRKILEKLTMSEAGK